MSDGFDAGVPEVACSLSLDPRARSAGTRRIYDQDPKTGVLQRALVTVVGWLPIQWLL